MSSEAIIALIQGLLAIAPQMPEIVAGVGTSIRLISSGSSPTPEEQASISSALDAINAKIQAS